MKIRTMMLAATVSAVCACTSAAFTVDANLPAGNAAVEKIEGDTVYLHQELRDTTENWFYWKLRVSGAKGRKVTFRFTRSPAVGSRGAAVSFDRGKTWEWTDLLQPAKTDAKTGDHADANSFAWDFKDRDEAWFCQAIPYDQWNWEAFVGRHEADRGRLFRTGVLCKSRKGRDVEYARFGRLDGRAKYRIFLSARHHAQEMAANYSLEGALECVFAKDDLGAWLRENVEFRVVPFVDKDGVVDGDQGKRRAPHDHGRDYNDDHGRAPIYPEVKAIMKMLREWRPQIVHDYHCPWLRGSWFEKDNSNEYFYIVGVADPKGAAAQRRFSKILESVQTSGVDFSDSDFFWFGRGWNSNSNYAQGKGLKAWALALPSVRLTTTFEIPFANSRFKTLHQAELRAFGRDAVKAYREFLTTPELPYCVDGVYPHLAMSNAEGECGTGAVVPWAGRLWAITYGPHCPAGSSDKLYEITTNLTRKIREESIGGTPANRLIHRETNQLLIGPYVIDAKGGVRTVPAAKMPGRLTGAARHLSDPANKVYVATMETGLYELDMKTLAVNTLIRENGKNDREIAAAIAKAGGTWPAGWGAAPVTKVPGYHGKGLCSGFGRVFVANNGEDSDEARRNPFVTSGVLADWSEFGQDWRTIRRCQFTDISTRDGIFGNEHPGKNPVWALGWDAKSVILAVTDDGRQWSTFRLPKGSHAYDGAHGWNTEWPRIRDVGLGNGKLLATMHGTFWSFPETFSVANPQGLRPLSTYLRVIGDFCRWDAAPGGGAIVFGCDDHAKNEFLGKRKLKADAPKRERSVSNLWFVKPEDLASFGPPSGEGWVWLDEDVKAGALSDPFLCAGYGDVDFRCNGKAELVKEGDWVRVRALEDIRSANARFVLGPKKVDVSDLLAAVEKNGYVEVTDDNGRVWKFPNVNGDKTVICREVATERDLLYVGGVFYELPAENAGGFAALRPIALADAPVRTIRADYGLIFVNGKPMALDSLWKNGSASKAYWLWRKLWK